METKFQVGDTVSAFGVEGVVINIRELGEYPIICNFANKHSVSFTADGKYLDWHKEPSLKFIERPKKMVKKYLVLYTDGSGGFFISTVFYKSVDEFNTKHFRFKSIHLIKESEIEVEE